MPGARLRSFRLGDRSELLVQHLLTGLAFTTPVPRQEDIGFDFLCSLIGQTKGSGLLRAGPFFTVQAKSKGTEEILYEQPHQVDWITQQENPMLICIADRDTTSMDIYSTWNLLCGVLAGHTVTRAATKIILRLDQTSDKWPHVRDLQDGTQEILLGSPIAHVTHDDIVDEDRTKEVAAVLAAWILFDRLNIVNSRAGLHWVVAPRFYETNKMPLLDDLLAVAGYWNPKNLEKCARNLVLSAASLWRTLAAAGLMSSTAAPWAEGIPLLRDLLSWCYEIDPSIRDFIPEFRVH
ncbi:MAG: hypothetical protein JWN74_2393 [Acidobacteriaceae bacterium]|nr:hypothetical protein [Acidobacteriaceae bacterium]